MKIEEMTIKQNKRMQEYCIKRLEKISEKEESYNKAIKEVYYYRSHEFYARQLGACKTEYEHFSYFLYLLQEEEKKLLKEMKDNEVFKPFQLRF